MDDNLLEQAVQLERLLPQLMRRLFTLDPDHPLSNLPVAQLRVCSILQSGPRPMSLIAEELGISMSAMTQIADRLERAQMVERVPLADDRRVKQLQLTPHGDGLMRSRRETRIHSAADALEQLSPEMRPLVLQTILQLLNASLGIPAIPQDDLVDLRLSS